MAKYEMVSTFFGCAGIFLWIVGGLEPEIAIGTLFMIASFSLLLIE